MSVALFGEPHTLDIVSVMNRSRSHISHAEFLDDLTRSSPLLLCEYLCDRFDST